MRHSNRLMKRGIKKEMTKTDIISNISAEAEIPKSTCEAVLDAFAEEVKKCLVNEDKLVMKGFISFEVSERPEREGRNPQTGEVTTFPSVKTVKCRISKAIKDAVNGK